MPLILDVVCRCEEEAKIYGISSIDNSIYECDLINCSAKRMFSLPDIDGDWFAIAKCRNFIAITSRRENRVYIFDIEKLIMQFVDFSVEKKGDMGQFLISDNYFIYFFDRINAKIYKLNCDLFKLEEIDCFINLERIENISRDGDNVALFDLSNQKYCIWNIRGNKVIYNSNHNVAYTSFMLINDEVYLLDKKFIYQIGFDGIIRDKIVLPSSTAYTLIRCGKLLGLYSRLGEIYVRENTTWRKVENELKNALMVTTDEENIFRTISINNWVETGYFYFDNVSLKFSGKYLNISDEFENRQYCSRFLSQYYFSVEGRKGISDLQSYLYYIQLAR